MISHAPAGHGTTAHEGARALGKRHAPARWFRRPSTDWRSRRRAPPRPVPQWDHACPQETARRAEAPPGPDTRPARLHAAAEDGHRTPRLRAGRRRRRRAGAVRLRRRTGRRGLRRPGRRPPRARLPCPRPDIVPRAAWIGDAARDQPPPRYDDQVVAVFIHHTDSPNGYDCADAPGILRALYGADPGPRLGRPRLQLRRRPLRHRLRGPRRRRRPARHRRPHPGLQPPHRGHRRPRHLHRGRRGARRDAALDRRRDRLEARSLRHRPALRRAAGLQQRRQPLRRRHHRRPARRRGPQRRLHDRLPGRRPARAAPGDQDLAARLQGRDAGTGPGRDTGTDTQRVTVEDDAHGTKS